MEYAIIVPPWPDWMSVELPESEVAVVAVADRVISARAGDAIDPERASTLLEAMMGSEAELHAWLYTFSEYRQRLLKRVGTGGIQGFSASLADDAIIDTRVPLAVLESGPPGWVVLSCTAGELGEIGLPPHFLRQYDNTDRIGVCPSGSRDADWNRYPSCAEMIDAYQFVVIAGGDHCSDCLIASKHMEKAALAELADSAASALEWDPHFLGYVEGNGYELLYERTL